MVGKATLFCLVGLQHYTLVKTGHHLILAIENIVRLTHHLILAIENMTNTKGKSLFMKSSPDFVKIIFKSQTLSYHYHFNLEYLFDLIATNMDLFCFSRLIHPNVSDLDTQLV